MGWQIYPYVKSVAVFKCPDDSTNLPGTNVSYGFNRNCSIYTTNQGGVLSQGDDGALLRSTPRLKQFCCLKVVNSGYYDITTPDGPDSKGVNGDDQGRDQSAGNQYSGGSVSGCGLGGAYDLNGYNTNGGSANSGQNVMYATGYFRDSRTDATSRQSSPRCTAQ